MTCHTFRHVTHGESHIQLARQMRGHTSSCSAVTSVDSLAFSKKPSLRLLSLGLHGCSAVNCRQHTCLMCSLKAWPCTYLTSSFKVHLRISLVQPQIVLWDCSIYSNDIALEQTSDSITLTQSASVFSSIWAWEKSKSGSLVLGGRRGS